MSRKSSPCDFWALRDILGLAWRVIFMKYYFAPLEGITGFVLRNAYNEVFGGIDKFFTPFVAPNMGAKFSPKEKRDIDPANNKVENLVPQILANDVTVFSETAKALFNLGYKEINLNLGCPSGTVVSKNRGSGFLSLPDELDRFLDGIFTDIPYDISIKTRLGNDDLKVWPKLIEIYNKYPLKELIIHPRLRTDMYKASPRMDEFMYAVENSKHELCYNGDLFSYEDVEKVASDFPSVNSMMLGRGLLMHPGFINNANSKETRKAFHNAVYEGYKAIIPDEKNLLVKMKELWFYLSKDFPDGDDRFKAIKKAKNLTEYRSLMVSW